MDTLTVLDVVLVVIMLIAAIGGWRSSGAARVGRLAGLVLGALLGWTVAGAVTPATTSTGWRLLIAVGLVILGALVLGGLGGWVGAAVSKGLRSLRLGVADRLLGAAVSGVLALLICWLLLTTAAQFWPDIGLADATNTSSIIDAVGNVLPEFNPTRAMSGLIALDAVS